MERSKKKLDGLMLGFTAYMADRRPKPLARESRYGYRRRVMKAIEIAQAGGHSILAGDVRTLRYVLGKLSPHPTTQTGYIAALQAFYDFLIAQGLRKDNPARTVGRPPTLKHAPRPLELNACSRYEAAAVDLGLCYETIAILGLYQGWRRSEIRHARWNWFFQADGRTWCDVTGKGSKVARVPIHTRTEGLLMRLRTAHNDPVWLLPSPFRSGRPIGGTWMSNAHHRICEQAGLPITLRLHQLRHSYATYLRAAGADQALVQLGLRHSDPKSTAIYMQVFPEELARAAERLSFR
jgi:integrase/recombinase XerD